MKKFIYLIVLALILGLVLAGCTLLSNIGQVPTSEQSGVAYLTKGPPSGLVGLWHFDEGSGTTAFDSSINPNNGAIHGASWDSGLFGSALIFDGDDYVQLPASNAILSTDTFTIEAWFKTSVNHPVYGGTEGRLINLHRMGTASTAVSLYVEQDQIGLLYYTGAAHIYVKYTIDYHDDAWHHIAVTHDATTYRLYYDGVEVASQDDAFGDFGTYPAYLGTYNGSVRFFDGTIDEVRIWDKALQPVDILNPDISVEKSGPESAHVGDNITYNYTVTNTGYVPLSDVTVSDDLAGDAEYVSGDTNGGGLLDLEETWIYTIIDYIISVDAPEYLCNIATAEGWYEEDWVSATSNEVCIHTMGARTIGYWKNHSDNWCAFPRGSMFFAESPSTLLAYFPGNGIEEDGVNPLEMLRAQLIAAELNYACFEDDFHYTRYEAADIFGTMRDAEALLQRVYLAAGDDDLNAFWSGLSKKQQKNVKQIANPLKDTLEEFNAMGDEIFE